MPFELFGHSYRWIPEPFEWLRPAANRAGRALVDWRLRWRYRAASANCWPPARALVFDTRAWYQHQPDSGGAGGPQYFEIFPPERVTLVPPLTIAKPVRYGQGLARQHEILLPAASVIVLPNGRFDGRWQDVTTAAGEMLTQMSFYGIDSSYQEAMQRLRLPLQSEAPRHLPGDAAVIASRHADWNYFHWLINAVPRFELLRRAGLPPELADWYILTAPPEPFQVETLARLGVPPQKIVVVDGTQHVTADRLWATVSLLAAGQSSAWAAVFLRDLFLDDVPRGRLRLFLSRRDTPRHPLVNEPEIEAWLVRRGFQSVLPRKLTVREQARLFAQAEVVVGANGAGLANLVFCPAGTKVFELFSPDWLGTYSWEVSSLRQHEYYYLIGAESHQRSEFGAYQIALPDLARLLELAGL